jgi:hypothetical protein
MPFHAMQLSRCARVVRTQTQYNELPNHYTRTPDDGETSWDSHPPRIVARRPYSRPLSKAVVTGGVEVSRSKKTIGGVPIVEFARRTQRTERALRRSNIENTVTVRVPVNLADMVGS